MKSGVPGRKAGNVEQVHQTCCLGRLLQLCCLIGIECVFPCQCLPQIAHDRRMGSISFVTMCWLVRASSESHACWNQWLYQNPTQPHDSDASVVMVSSWSLAPSVDSMDMSFQAFRYTSTMLVQSETLGVVGFIFVDCVLSCWAQSFILGRIYLAWLQYCRKDLPGLTTVLACWRRPIRDSNSHFVDQEFVLHSSMTCLRQQSFSGGRQISMWRVSSNMPVMVDADHSILFDASGTPSVLQTVIIMSRFVAHPSQPGFRTVM